MRVLKGVLGKRGGGGGVLDGKNVVECVVNVVRKPPAFVRFENGTGFLTLF
jgi:hypothetical protein